MKLYKHFVITRFNIRIHYGCKLKNPENNPMDRILDEDYLEERFYIFENYTFPSMKNQKNKDFTWIIMFHKKTPDKFKKRIQKLKHEFNFVDLYLDDGEKFNFHEYCDNYEKDIEYFLTTRIDNDDMINEEYISKVQEYADENFHQCIISFEKGMKYDLNSQKKFEYIRKDNHFLSMIGSREECILQYNHAKVLDSGKEIVFLNPDLYMWTEIIHDSNVINKVKKVDTENEI